MFLSQGSGPVVQWEVGISSREYHSRHRQTERERENDDGLWLV